MKKTDRQTATTFTDLLRQYEHSADRLNTADGQTALHELATAVTYSVLKKCIDPQRKNGNGDSATGSGLNPALVKMYQQLHSDLTHLQHIRTVSAKGDGYTDSYNSDGDRVRVLTNKNTARQYRDTMNAYATDTLTDSMDLYQTAVLAILKETDRQRNADGLTVAEWLEKPYTVRQLKKRVYIKIADSVNGWETVEVTPIQQIYKAVRRYIMDNKTPTVDPRCKYVYIADLAIDSDSDESATVYRRLPRYAQNVSVDLHIERNGNTTMTATATIQETTDTDTIIETLGLTARETTVLKLKLQGYGNKAIATYTGTTENSVKGCCNRIREKATAHGLTPPTK